MTEAYFAVGRNHDQAAPTWFYAFASWTAADEFVTMAQNDKATIDWAVYPCAIDTPTSAFAAAAPIWRAP